MTTVRIANTPHLRDELPRPNSPDAVSSAIGDRLERVDTHDDFYNIRSRSKAPSLDQRRSRWKEMVKEDDPGWRKPGNFKQKQVLTGRHYSYYVQSKLNLCRYSGQNAYVVYLSINRGHLWRHWDQPSLRLLIHFQFETLTSGACWGALDNHLELVRHSDGAIRVCYSSCR